MSKPAVGINFLDYDQYQSGGGIPNGRFILYFDPMNFKPEPRSGVRQQFSDARLGVMVTAYNPDNKDDIHTQFLAFGKDLNKAYTVNPDPNIKGLLPIPGAAAIPFPASSNWGYFLKSMLDMGMPRNYATNDLTAMDGVWADVAQNPEPEDRKGYRNSAKAMSEVEAPEIKGSGKILQIVDFVENGKPWEGGGGMPEGFPEHNITNILKKPAPATAGAAKPSPRPGPVAPKPGPKPPVSAAKGPAKPAPKAAAEATDLDPMEVHDAAIQAIAAILGENVDGLLRIKLRNGVFANSNKTNPAMGQAILEQFFATDDSLNGILGEIGYVIEGLNVVVAS